MFRNVKRIQILAKLNRSKIDRQNRGNLALVARGNSTVKDAATLSAYRYKNLISVAKTLKILHNYTSH